MKLPKGIKIRNNSYVAYVTRPPLPGETRGLPVRKTIGVVGCVGVKELVRERADLERQVRAGLYPPPKAEPPTPEPVGPPPATCDELWEVYERNCREREVKRLDRLKLAWSHLKPVFGAKPAADVRPSEIAAYVSSRKEAGKANATCNRELAVLKAAYRHGARLEMIDRVPTFPKKLKEANAREGFIELEDYEALAANASGWLRTFLAIGFTWGWRKSEILGLRVRNVDLLGGWLTLRAEDTKNGESRRVGLTTELKLLLTECVRGKQPNDFVLTREDGSRVGQPRKNWYDLCCRSKRQDGTLLGKLDEHGHYSGLQMHDLRRSAAKRLLGLGEREPVIMGVAGWKTRSMFDRYFGKPTNKELIGAAGLVDRQAKSRSKKGSQKRHQTDTTNFVEAPVPTKSLN
jgi:integrase